MRKDASHLYPQPMCQTKQTGNQTKDESDAEFQSLKPRQNTSRSFEKYVLDVLSTNDTRLKDWEFLHKRCQKKFTIPIQMSFVEIELRCFGQQLFSSRFFLSRSAICSSLRWRSTWNKKEWNGWNAIKVSQRKTLNCFEKWQCEVGSSTKLMFW